MSDGPLGGRTALVTGASRGIGLETARALIAAGARVVMVARTPAALARAADEVGGHALPGDVSTSEGVRSIAAAVEGQLGGAPDIVVSSAGAFSLAPLVETDPDDFERQLAVNVLGPFLLLRAFLPAMMERGSGHVVNIGSVAGRVALPGNAGYAASKYGLRGMHEVLLEELRSSPVRATLIEPAATDTPLWDLLDPDSRQDLPSRAQMLRPERVARAVLYAVTQPSDVEVSTLALRANG